MRQVTFDVPNISCEHCARTISETLKPLDGVRDVRVDVPGRRVSVAFDDGATSVERMGDALAEEEYPVAAVREP